MSSRELSAGELRELANYLPQQINDPEMTLEVVKKVVVLSQGVTDEAKMFSKMRKNADYLANSVQKIIAHEMKKIKR